jgi:DNA-directed RNA polymerase specialized sigma24 family protein
MPLSVTCNCALCTIEAQLLSELSGTEPGMFREFLSASPTLRQHSSVASLLSQLKNSSVAANSDELLRDLVAIRQLHPAFVENLLVLAFLPVLHGTTRRAVRQQPGLSPEDIAQQALSVLLEYLHSGEFRMRQSHFAFAISRAVKRQLFAWVRRESAKTRFLNHDNGAAVGELAAPEAFERYALLGHFLHRCVTNGLLTDAELDLLTELKLNGASREEIAGCNGTSSNAIRQRLKRLIAKLRRLAKERVADR